MSAHEYACLVCDRSQKYLKVMCLREGFWVNNLSYFVSSNFQSKIVRVLNLWQKNAVFKSDIIQPLLDMAAGIPPPSVTPVMPSSAAPVNNTTPGQ